MALTKPDLRINPATDAPLATDLNAIVGSGPFRYSGNTPNAPSTAYGGGFQSVQSPTNMYQIAMVDGEEYFRAQRGGVWRPWRKVFTQGSILGTVAQASGIPTGAVIEQGSNANGNYVKFADGTMICRRTAYYTPPAGAQFTDFTATFAASFVGTVGVSVCPTSNYGNAFAVAGAVSLATATEVTCRVLNPYNASQTSTLSSVSVVAIGRWF